MGVNTVADGEQPRPSQQKGYRTGGKILAASLFAHYTELYCDVQTPSECTSGDNIVVKINEIM